MKPIPDLEPEEQQRLEDFEAGSLRSVGSPALLDQLRAAVRSTGSQPMQPIRTNLPDSSAAGLPVAQQEIPDSALRADNAERLGALPSLPIDRKSILEALRDSRPER